MRISFLIIFFLTLSLNAHTDLTIVRPHTSSASCLACVYDEAHALNAAQALKHLLESTGLMACTLIQAPMPTAKSEIAAFLPKGFSIVLFIQVQDDRVIWRLYDATQAQMLKGKSTRSSELSMTYRLVADEVYTVLMHQPSYFLTQIAYIKKNPSFRYPQRSELCCVDPATGQSKTLLKDNRTLVAPSWAYADERHPWLMVSELTPSNVRLLGVSLQGDTWPIVDVPGTCVGSAQCMDASFVYVRSGVVWHYEFNKTRKKGMHTRLTPADHVCGCPCVTAQGDIVYSSKGKVYRCDKKTHAITQVPLVGTVLSPHVHQRTNKLLFTQSVKGVMQLFVSDLAGQAVKQITSGDAHKVDGCWSPCGNYVAYTRRFKGAEQIAVLHLLTGVEKIVTPPTEKCGYPAWSEDILYT